MDNTLEEGQVKTKERRNSWFRIMLQAVIAVLLAGALFFVMTNKAAAEKIDQTILLEKRHPGYWEYLSHPQIYYSHGESDNLLISSLQSGEYSGFQVVVNPDFSVRVDGVNNEEDVHLRYGNVVLSEGQYQLLDGAPKIDGAYSYVWDGENTLVSLPDASIFSVSTSPNMYEVGVVIFKGQEVHQTYTPMLIREGDKQTFTPYRTTFPLRDDLEQKISMVFVPSKDVIAKEDIKIWESSQKTEKVDKAMIYFYDGSGYILENGRVSSD
ncbi:hypothetical protein [Bilifractor porci]|uniref:Uncharacterized protein n=1 Tax=Bilifractor porci TaxID=2606636 RepID=A0A7X2TQ03_9FIRM|nr:hypothetical protein [Bilifractor porci]MST82523.1 hypothetical protein [Bilifractor porci]